MNQIRSYLCINSSKTNIKLAIHFLFFFIMCNCCHSRQDNNHLHMIIFCDIKLLLRSTQPPLVYIYIPSIYIYIYNFKLPCHSRDIISHHVIFISVHSVEWKIDYYFNVVMMTIFVFSNLIKSIEYN